jgi:hypothetical protein
MDTSELKSNSRAEDQQEPFSGEGFSSGGLGSVPTTTGSPVLDEIDSDERAAELLQLPTLRDFAQLNHGDAPADGQWLLPSPT